MLLKHVALACTTLFFTTAQTSPLEKRDAYQITGVQSGRGNDGAPPFRLEIRELQKNADQWNLYLIGLRRMMDMNDREKTSYYQLAGMFCCYLMCLSNLPYDE